MKTIRIQTILFVALITLTTNVFAKHHHSAEILGEIVFQVEDQNWQEAKSLIDFFQGSSAQKDTMSAYQINKLEHFVLEQIKNETPDFNQLRNSFSINKALDYLDHYPYGKHYDQVNQLIEKENEEQYWLDVKAQDNFTEYSKYLNMFPNGKFKTQAKLKIAGFEQSTYERAVSSNNPRLMRNFLDQYPNSPYQNEIRLKLEQLKGKDTYERLVRENSISGYEQYLNNHPSSPYKLEITQHLADEYLDSGDYAFSRKNYQTALYNYEKFLNINTNKTIEKRVLANLAVCRKLQHQDGGFISFITMDTTGSAGYMFAHVDTTTPGFYFSLKIKPEAVNITPNETIDDEGNYSGFRSGTATGDTKSSKFTITTGMTYNIRYPFWGYLGAGFEFNNRYDEVQTTDIFDETEFVWVENTDQTSMLISPEAGLIYKQDGFALNYGVRYSNTLIHQVGLGVVF